MRKGTLAKILLAVSKRDKRFGFENDNYERMGERRTPPPKESTRWGDALVDWNQEE